MSAGVLDQSYELVPVDDLKPHPDNPRRGNLAVIGESVAANGFYGSVVAQRSTGYVLAGNHRLAAARAAGVTKIPVLWADVDDIRAKRILLVDNRSNDQAIYDDAELAAILEDAPDLTGTGYTIEEMAALSVKVAGQTGPEEFPAYDESAAEKVPTARCPDCGHTFPR